MFTWLAKPALDDFEQKSANDTICQLFRFFEISCSSNQTPKFKYPNLFCFEVLRLGKNYEGFFQNKFL